MAIQAWRFAGSMMGAMMSVTGSCASVRGHDTENPSSAAVCSARATNSGVVGDLVRNVQDPLV